MGFRTAWGKLLQPSFTTFRYPRADRDWKVGEVVQVVLKPRTPGRVILGTARIVGKEQRELDDFFQLHCPDTPSARVPLVTEEEAQADGFPSSAEMTAYMEKQYGLDYISLFNKLTLEWIKRE